MEVQGRAVEKEEELPLQGEQDPGPRWVESL